jgi:hypothetical protein
VGPVARKEFADHLSGLRFGILLILIAVAAIAAVYAAGTAIREAVGSFAAWSSDWPPSALAAGLSSRSVVAATVRLRLRIVLASDGLPRWNL